MNINFCFIDGISTENEPYFDNIEQQKTYFDNIANTTIITNTFYPPYYHNVIKLDSVDIDLSSNYNYVWFEYSGKRYYYFIDNLSYISEDVIAISITMDTIQTYFFDIKVHSGVIRRKFIDRYYHNQAGWFINRNYIRENVSCGTLGTHTITNMSRITDYDVPSSTDDHITGWYVITQSNNKNLSGATYSIRFKSTISPYYVQLVPVINNEIGNTITLYDASGSPFKGTTERTIGHEGGLAVTRAISYCPLNIFYGYVNYSDDGVHVDANSNISAWGDDNACAYVASLQTNDSHAKVPYFSSLGGSLSKSIALNVTRNASKNIDYNSKYIPAMLDENYYRISYGDGREQTQYPIHLLTTSHLTLEYTFDWLGYLYFRMYESGTVDNQWNKYNTAVLVNPSGNDILVSGAEDYEAHNKWAIIGAIASTAISFGASILTANPLPAIGSVPSQVVGTTANITAEAAGSLPTFTSNKPVKYGGATLGDRRLKYNYKLAPWVGDDSNAYPVGSYNIRTRGTQGLTIPGNAFNAFQITAGAVTAKANAYSSPATVKATSNLMQNTGLHNGFIRREEVKVSDYEACAQYYHRYGYLVNEYLNPTTTIFADVNSRYYFNYIELSECDIELSCLQFDSCINDISTRFQSGIRLWNPTITTTSSGTSISFSIGDYRYDNVERSALNG